MEIAEKIINATQPEIIAWNSINWNHAKNQVQKTQARIVKALQEKRWRDVRSLQRMLTKSLSAKQLAVKQITENKGKLTPGVDGETWSGTKQKAEQVYKLQWKGYKAKPLRRIYIPKADGNRPLGIPTMYDRAMQALQKMSLEPIAETLGDNHSYGFRPMRSAADAIEYSLCLLSKRNSARWILDADIRSCFDNIDHNWLIKNIPMNARILKQWLKSGYLEKGIKHETIMGTPQGGVVSPIIANMTLDGMEDLIRKSFRSSKLKGENDKVNVVRYADDFLITGVSKVILEEKVQPLISNFLAKRGLELSKEKTRIVNITEGVEFLGFSIRKYPCGKVLTKPSSKSQKRFCQMMKVELKTLRTATQQQVVAKLHPKLTGWRNYYMHCAAKQVFSKMDNLLHQKLWRWAKRRHPNKSQKWIKNKYFYRYHNQNWAFGFWEDRKEKSIFRHLPRMSNIPIKRHGLIKGEFNPYDKKWQEYTENRASRKMKFSMTDTVYKIWKSQKGQCPCCKHRIDESTKWHIHHALPRNNGGSDKINNLLLMHPECHRQIHSRSIAGLPIHGNFIYA